MIFTRIRTSNEVQLERIYSKFAVIDLHIRCGAIVLTLVAEGWWGICYCKILSNVG